MQYIPFVYVVATAVADLCRREMRRGGAGEESNDGLAAYCSNGHISVFTPTKIIEFMYIISPWKMIALIHKLWLTSM